MTARFYGGVETGGTKCVCAVADAAGRIVERAEFRTDDPESTLGRVIAFFHGWAPPDGAPPGSLVAVGIGSFGPVDVDPESPAWGHVTSTPKPGWRDVDVAPRLREQLHVPVLFDSDVGAAAYGEHVWGAGRGLPSVSYLTVGTGIGAGFVLDGKVWHGALAPEVGHIRLPRVEGDTFAGCCPFHGDCWEGLACGPALEARYGCPPAELPDDHEAWQLEASYVAAGILAITMVVCPHRLVLGGGVGGRPVLLDLVRDRLRRLIGGYLQHPLFGSEIARYLVSPGLGADAGVLGAVALARDGQGSGPSARS